MHSLTSRNSHDCDALGVHGTYYVVCVIHRLHLPVTVCILNEVHLQTAYPDSELDSQAASSSYK